MTQRFLKRQLPLALTAGILLGLVAWKEDQSGLSKFQYQDTIPEKKDKRAKNFDEVLEELEKGQQELEQSMKNFKMPDIEIPYIDVDKIMADVDVVMKEIDPQKIKVQVEASLKNIDPEEMKVAVAEAMKEVDAVKIKAEVDAALAKVDMEKIKADIEKMKQTDFSKIEAEMKKIKPEIEEGMKRARVEIEKAKEDIKAFKAFEEGLAKDGLIDKENYTVEHKEGKLIINGKVQEEAVYHKYRSFLEKHKSFTIKKSADDFDVDID